jgi:hypothetical protein
MVILLDYFVMSMNLFLGFSISIFYIWLFELSIIRSLVQLLTLISPSSALYFIFFYL